jgi:hypothetical protein
MSSAMLRRLLGMVDGVAGKRTRQAIQAYEQLPDCR